MMRPTTTSGHARQRRAGSLVQTLVARRFQGATMVGMVRGPRGMQVAVVCALAVGVLVGLGTAWLGWLAPSFSRAASSPVTLVLMCAAGWSLMLAGAVTLWRGRASRGVAFLAAGFAWFMSEWANPASAPAIVFTVGLLFANAWPALLAHAVLEAGASDRISSGPSTGPGRRLHHQPRVLGLVPTLAFDPVTSRCSLCPDNLLALASDPGLVAGATRLGFGLQAIWVLAAARAHRPRARARVGQRASPHGGGAGAGGHRPGSGRPRTACTRSGAACSRTTRSTSRCGRWPRSHSWRSRPAKPPVGCDGARPDSEWRVSPSSWRPPRGRRAGVGARPRAR